MQYLIFCVSKYPKQTFANTLFSILYPNIEQSDQHQRQHQGVEGMGGGREEEGEGISSYVIYFHLK